MSTLYRVRQFWHTVSVQTEPHELQRAQALLNPEQWDLFARLQPGEMYHAVSMLRSLLEQGENQPDLLVAALLHDVGKIRYRLNPLERAMVVLVRWVKPEWAHRCGVLPSIGWNDLPGWRKAFIVAEQHAEWGAEIARLAGVSSLTETLIREHHHPHMHDADTLETSLLRKLWAVDNES